MIRSWGFMDLFYFPMIQYLGFIDSFDAPMIQTLGFVNFFDIPMIRSLGFVDWFDDPMIRSLGFVGSFDVPMIQYLGFIDSFKVCANSREDWNAWRICPEDSIFMVLFPEICMFWLDRLEDLLFRFPSRSLSEVVHVIHRTISSDRFLIWRSSLDSLYDYYLGMFLIDLVDQYIKWWSDITVHYARYVIAISRYGG